MSEALREVERTSHRPERRSVLRAAGIAALIVSLACGGGEEAGIADDPDPDPTGTAARTSSGSDPAAPTAGVDCALPDVFPAETPIVPECFHVHDTSRGSFTALVLSTTLTPDEALAFFEEELPASGFSIDGRETYEDGVVSLSVSGHGIDATLEVQPRSSPDAEATAVNYVIL